MDKRVIFASAGSGKTTQIVNSLSREKRSLIVTYTNRNYDNLQRKIIEQFDGKWPESITLMKYFSFLYQFCFKPFLSDKCGGKGLIFEPNPNRRVDQRNWNYYRTQSGYYYSNRMALLLEKAGVIDDIKLRIEKYFDEFIIDEVQDIAGRDFNFLEHLMETNVSMLFVGDFYQHTFDTSRDGPVNKNLFNDFTKYKKRFENKGIMPDTTTLVNSWRCSKSVCDFITTEIGIDIKSNKAEDTSIRFVSDEEEKERILNDDNIVKMHLKESSKYGPNRRNWGDTKGEDCYQDVCVMLNKKTKKLFFEEKLNELPPSTQNRLYVAITRAHGNVYFIEE